MGDLMDRCHRARSASPSRRSPLASGIWYLATRRTGDATDSLIKQVQSAPATVTNLTSGIATLSTALAVSDKQMNQVRHSTDRWAGAIADVKTFQAAGDVSKLTQAITQQEQKLIQLRIGLAEVGDTTGMVGHDMLALSVQTDLADSKVTQLNQAWDQYMSPGDRRDVRSRRDVGVAAEPRQGHRHQCQCTEGLQRDGRPDHPAGGRRR